MPRWVIPTSILIAAGIVIVLARERPNDVTNDSDVANAANTNAGAQYSKQADEAGPRDLAQSTQALSRQVKPPEINDSPLPSWPSDVEHLLFEFFARQYDLEFTSISSIECDQHTCEIVFTGTDANPLIVDGFSQLQSRLFRQGFNVMQGSLGTREIAPGAREFVMNLSNIPYEEPDSKEQEVAD